MDAYNRDKARWQEQVDYLKDSHFDLSVRHFDQTFMTTNKEQEERTRLLRVDSSRKGLQPSSSQGSMGTSNNLDHLASLRKSSICLGSDKKYADYSNARTTSQDGFRLPIPPARGRSQLSSQLPSIKEKDLEEPSQRSLGYKSG